MDIEESPLPFQAAQNDDGVGLFETQSGHGYLYYHYTVKVGNIRDPLVRRELTKTCHIIGFEFSVGQWVIYEFRQNVSR
jgi:hypothetical protein